VRKLQTRFGPQMQFLQTSMATITSFRDLDVWQAAMELAVMMYRMTDPFPRREQFGLSAQIRRSAVSIPANIAEGHNRRQSGPYRNHVHIALGSQGELDTLIELALRLQFLTADSASEGTDLITRVGQMLGGLSRSLKTGNQDDGT
jgi:four helix bundle protein